MFETHVLQRETWMNALAAGFSTGLISAGAARLTLQYTKYAVIFGSAGGLGIGILEDVYAIFTGHSIKDEKKIRKGSADFWIPFWDWERGSGGLGLFFPKPDSKAD
ncbi:hypothetical protein HDU84_007739 [Entophlyctis sp. JEL0112]|nr:hypothetical protein HDU84_007739 [Entophlyctis sp. JEL0112]